MRILFYNWAIFYGDNIGGGVGVYQKNLIDGLSKKEGIECYFLCSGEIYSPFSKKPFIREMKVQYSGCRSFALVNSTVISPAWYNYFNIKSCFSEDTSVLDVLVDFIKTHGPFDVFHLNNIEGIPLNALKVKDYFPNMKIIFSLHNYYPFCPSVNLFDFSNHAICKDYLCGEHCLKCREVEISYRFYKEKVRNYKKYISSLGIFRFLAKPWMKRNGDKLLNHLKENLNGKAYETFRNKCIGYINKYVDLVISVSNRVREIATNYGIDEDKNIVLYIGTKFSEFQATKSRNNPNLSDVLNIAYLGYAREDKGFFFLIKSLMEMPEEYASKISFKLIACGVGALNNNDRNILKNKFKTIDFIDGYKHDELDGLLSDIHLGVVPVIWEDNLPQVAIELVALGIPILASSSGGVSELTKSDYFRFKVGDSKDFNEKLINLINNRSLFDDFWLKKMHLPSINDHINNLLEIY